MERALFHAARGRGRTSPNPLVGAVVVSRGRRRRRAGVPRARRRAARRGARARRRPARAPAARRSTARSSRAATSGPHRARASAGSSTPASSGSSRRSRIRIPPCAAAASRFCASRGVAVEVGLSAETAIALNQPFFTLMRERRPFVDPQGGDEPRRPHRRGARPPDAADVGGGESPRPSRPRRSRRDRRRQSARS